MPEPYSDNSEDDVRPALFRFVVVDDNESARFLLGRLLEKMGHQVCIACGAEEAMPMIRNSHPHIVISDIEMPGLSGYDLARWIRQEILTDVPFVVALTGYSRASDRIASLEAGFDEHLVKPISIKTLHQLLGKLQARLTDVPPERSA